jgi:thermostable 8-oxoguanine DNA glycosylase
MVKMSEQFSIDQNEKRQARLFGATDNTTVLWDGPFTLCSSGYLQTVRCIRNDAMHVLALPSPFAPVCSGVLWGEYTSFYTPAFWRTQVWFRELSGDGSFALGRDLFEESVVCLLGGFGFRAELGLAAFERLRNRRLLNPDVSIEVLEAALSDPLDIMGKLIRYRFPRQKAKYLHSLIAAFQQTDPSVLSDLELRNWVMSIPGVGYKTASWIVRNARASDEVAILDIHIVRACRHMGLFNTELTPERDYLGMERLFLNFAQALNVSAALLDATMWETVRLDRLPQPDIES